MAPTPVRGPAVLMRWPATDRRPRVDIPSVRRIDSDARPAYRDPALARRGSLNERRYVPIMFNALIQLITRDEEGQGLAEYALILALIAIVAIIALIFLGGQVSGILSNVGKSV